AVLATAYLSYHSLTLLSTSFLKFFRAFFFPLSGKGSVASLPAGFPLRDSFINIPLFPLHVKHFFALSFVLFPVRWNFRILISQV
ncbi:hypothetical protein AALA24_12855, partial [Anaerovoracaceae bacterium 42-11]